MAKELESLKAKAQYRILQNYSNDFLDFSSNDYLGLAQEQYDFTELGATGQAGSGGSRLLTGNSKLFENLEQEIAVWKKTEAAIFFGSGYLANLGTISALAGPADVIFSDELNHSSILDGIRLSGAKKFFYKHLDYGHLKELLHLHRAKYKNALLLTDTVFSMQGTCADLSSLIELKHEYDCALYLDEAHATGTMGKSGAGLYAALVEAGRVKANQVEIQMGTFSKACGVEGAYVAGSSLLIDYLKNFARTFIYSTAPSPYIVAMLRQNLQRLIAAEDKRLQLDENISYLRAKLDNSAVQYSNDFSAIFAIKVESNKAAIALSEKFMAAKILIKAIRPPTVPEPCLRICLHAAHSHDDIDKVLSILKREH